MEFNASPPTVMHIDLNSCFATIEQQANPFLRGRPLVVAVYNSPSGCILAPSIEAKSFGIKTGMRVKEGKKLCPGLIVMTPDPDKYRHVHLGLRKILSGYTNEFSPKSIDEFVLNLEDYSYLKRGVENPLFKVGSEIKERIREEIGEWITVSIGISTNRFLAKVASGLRKPDGLDEINFKNFKDVYRKLSLTDLPGIGFRNRARLYSVGIAGVLDFYDNPLWKLKAAFKSISARYWHLRLRGWEIDNIEFKRKSFGNSYALPHSSGKRQELLPILYKLTEKTTERLRNAGFKAGGVHVGIVFREKGLWHKGRKLNKYIFETRDVFSEMKRIMSLCPISAPVKILSETCFGLSSMKDLQLDLFEDMEKKKNLAAAIDDINSSWGISTLTYATSLELENKIHDRIAFGGVREL